jgi:hypothetical protein
MNKNFKKNINYILHNYTIKDYENESKDKFLDDYIF